MRTSTMCSWCHTVNDAEQRDCVNCGHDAHVPRQQCRCAACTVSVAFGNSGLTLMLVAPDSIRDHELRRRLTRSLPGPTCPAQKFDHIAAGLMFQYIIYQGLTNWPGLYVLRQWSADIDGPALSTRPLFVHEDLGRVRSVIPKGYVNVGRNDRDAGCIVEIWV